MRGGTLLKRIVEVCCYTMEDVKRSQRAGAKRVELCADMAAGGTTPSQGLIAQVIQTIPIDVAVMVRPRAGDAIYSMDEIRLMERDIAVAGELGAEGVVFGVLDESRYIDVPKMRRLVAVAKEYDLKVACHRCFDRARNPKEFLQELINLGVDRLLTSGQQPTAVEGIPLLKELIEIAKDQLSIMPGGKVRPHNLEPLLELDITEIHTGSMETVPSRLATPGAQVAMGTADDNVQKVINEADVAAIVRAFQSKT